MSVTYGFYNAINKDRCYNATQFSKIFDGIIKDGIFMSIGDKLMVSANEGMMVNVGTGKAWFNHTWTENDAALPLVVSPSDVVYDRIDAVVLEIDSSLSSRKNTIKIIKGTPNTTPNAPELTQSDTVNQYYLCWIYVTANTEEILQGNIINKVGTEGTPFVSGILETVNTEELLVQWNNEFGIWFDDVKNQLSEDAAGNLQMQMNRLKLSQEKVEASSGIWIGEAVIPANSTTYTISNSIIEEASIIDIYPKTSSDVKLLNEAGVSWIQQTGKIVLSFENAVTADCTIQNIMVRKVSNAKVTTYGSVTEVETIAFDYSLSGNLEEV